MLWDIVIYVIVALQAIAFGCLAFALLKLKNGPILRYTQRGLHIAKNSALIVTSALQHFGSSWMKGEELARETRGIAEGVQHGFRTDFGDQITYRSLIAQWLSAQSTLATFSMAVGFLSSLGRKKKKDESLSPPPGPGPQKRSRKAPRAPRPSLAHRLGLVPPIARPLGRLWNYGRLAWEVRSELKRRGISPF